MYGHDHVEVAKTLVRLKESYYHAFWTINARDSLERAIAIYDYHLTQNCRSDLAKLGSSTCAVQ